MADQYPDDEPVEHIICPKCGKPVLTKKMNLCYIARHDCPHCGAALLVEGDKITVEASRDD